MNKFESIEYIVKNGKYINEWMGAGLFEAIEEIINSNKDTFTMDELSNLLKKAENF